MKKSSRFRVNFADGKLNLFGIITDSTEFKNIDEMIKEKNLFDCSELEGASWNGLLNFNKYLAESNKEITLTNIPYNIFKHLRLMPDVNSKYTLQAFDIPTVNEAHNLEATQLFSVDELAKLLDDHPDQFFLVKDKHLFGKINHLTPSRFGSELYEYEANHDNKNDWFKNNFEEYNYWYDYTAFLGINISLALDMVYSLTEALKIILGEITLNVRQSEEALQKLLPEFKSNESVLGLEKISDKIDSSTKDLTKELQAIEGKSTLALLNLQEKVFEQGVDKGEPYYQIVQSFFEDYSSLLQMISQIEEIGADTGESIQKISITDFLKEQLTKVDDDSVGEELLEEVRDILEIMDPLSEDSWPDTKEEFSDMINAIDKSIFEAIVLIQGFDLIRQVLEHRMSEVMHTLGILETKPEKVDWKGIKEAVFKMIGKTLVTDQEKYACYFFLPKAVDTTEEKKSPGEVLLF